LTHSDNGTGKRGAPFTTARQPDRALIIVPLVDRDDRRPGESRQKEARGLAEAIYLEVIETLLVAVNRLRPATYLGSGKVSELATRVKADDIDLVIVDAALTPIQQRNLERELLAKVLDRTGLILEIFGERAQTREGRLQVELAHLNYQKSRLVRSWTHLERQRGGFGFLGGPGETQMESDRRMIETRVRRIESELGSVATRRRLQRRQRQRSDALTVALVGYTNAGKSTLFNALTDSVVFTHDQLFATLDPTLRRVVLPGGGAIILSDTVGFVADLPTTLIAAFRATLEEVIEADIILHVRDAADPNAPIQAEEVGRVLDELGIDVSDPQRVIEVWNKIDLLPPGERRSLATTAHDGQTVGPATVEVSALSGQGLDDLRGEITRHARRSRDEFEIYLDTAMLGRMYQLYEFGDLIEQTTGEDGAVTVRVRVPVANSRALRTAFPGARRLS